MDLLEQLMQEWEQLEADIADYEENWEHDESGRYEVLEAREKGLVAKTERLLGKQSHLSLVEE